MTGSQSSALISDRFPPPVVAPSPSVPAAGPREQQETQQLPYATVLTLEAVFTGKLVLTELQVSHCWGWHGSTDLPISTGLRAQEGWEWSRRGEGKK